MMYEIVENAPLFLDFLPPKNLTFVETQIPIIMTENRYSVNPAAESVCSAVAAILLTLFIIGAVVLIILGVVAFVDGDTTYGLIFCGGALVCFVIGLVNWASMKMLINISRSLYNINDAIRSQQSLIEK